MYLTAKNSLFIIVISCLGIILSGCQNIQLAESPIPVTAEFKTFTTYNATSNSYISYNANASK